MAMSYTGLPRAVREAQDRAQRLGFELSCEELVGRLLSVLAANVRSGGRILELGTGAGVGLAWVVSGLEGRGDVEVVTVDSDEKLVSEVRQAGWPGFVEFVVGDGAEEVGQLGKFDLIFPDAPGGKLTNFEGTILALAENGMIILDDMDLEQHDDDPDLKESLAALTLDLLSDSRLACVECPVSSGVILATRRALA